MQPLKGGAVDERTAVRQYKCCGKTLKTHLARLSLSHHPFYQLLCSSFFIFPFMCYNSAECKEKEKKYHSVQDFLIILRSVFLVSFCFNGIRPVTFTVALLSAVSSHTPLVLDTHTSSTASGCICMLHLDSIHYPAHTDKADCSLSFTVLR